MAGSSIGPVIDYYVRIFRDGLTIGGQQIPAVTAVEATVEVADYSPTTANGTYVIVGRSDGDQSQTATVTAQYGALGNQRIDEQYDLPGLVTVIRDGPAAAAARTPCIAVYDAVVRLVHADPTCGGIITNGRAVLITRAVFDQSDPSPQDGTVMASMQFWVTVHHSYIP